MNEGRVDYSCVPAISLCTVARLRMANKWRPTSCVWIASHICSSLFLSLIIADRCPAELLPLKNIDFPRFNGLFYHGGRTDSVSLVIQIVSVSQLELGKWLHSWQNPRDHLLPFPQIPVWSGNQTEEDEETVALDSGTVRSIPLRWMNEDEKYIKLLIFSNKNRRENHQSYAGFDFPSSP